MLPRRKRLSRSAFPQGRAGSRAASPVFSLSWGASAEGGAAAIVSKVVARRSVDRHLLKRRMLALMEPWCVPGRYLVAYARGPAAKLTHRELSKELTSLLSRVPNH